MTQKILIVDDEESIRFTFEAFLTEAGYQVATASDYEQAIDCLADDEFDLLFLDIIMEGKTGMELFREVKRSDSNARVIIITGAPSIETAAEAVRLGALDYILKPIRQQNLLETVACALRQKRLSDEKQQCWSKRDAIFTSVKDGIVTVDEKMRVVDVNQAAVELCGFKQDQSPGAFIRTVTQGCGGGCVEVLKESLATRKALSLRHVECRRRDSQKQIVSVSASPLIDHTNHINGCVMVLRDETRLHPLEPNAAESCAFDKIIGISSAMRRIKGLIKVLADVQTTVLVTGESGTGKELIADALHRVGERSDKPLVKVNCGALSDGILESELFGHVKGAFTGAVSDKVGRFELADGGTIFLDEIGDISPKMQLQLLRVIETMTFERLGSAKPHRADVRVVAATNRDLAEKVTAGEFREDLYFRLKVMNVHLPPLRERREDIPLLAGHIIEKFNRKFGKSIKAVSSDVEKLFQRHAWQGNVRELVNAIEHAFILCNQNVITTAHLPVEMQSQTGGITVLNGHGKMSEAEAIEQALEKAGGNKAKAARLLSMSRKTIYRKIDKYNISF